MVTPLRGDPLDLTDWILDALAPAPEGPALVVGDDHRRLVSRLRRRCPAACVTQVVSRRAFALPGQLVVSRHDALAVRPCLAAAVLATPDVVLALAAPELARVLRADGRVAVVVEGPRHLHELAELIVQATGTRLPEPPSHDVAAAAAALAPWLVVDDVVERREVLHLTDPRPVLGAVQALRPQLLGRLSSFTNWTTAMARLGAQGRRMVDTSGGLSMTLDVAVLRCRAAVPMAS